MSDLNKHVEIFWQELEKMYQRLKSGQDVAPAVHYRLEGKAQLLVDLGAIQFGDIQAVCELQLAELEQQEMSSYRELFWQAALNDKSVRLPIYMREAPVYKGK
jgi:hypothetical protein